MDIKELRTFVALAEIANYQKVAQILQYAPSTLNRQIQMLEQELGVSLFVKKGKYVQLTQDGLQFLDSARKIIDDYEQAIRNLDGKVTPRHVRVCGCELILVNGYSEMFSAFCQDYGTLHLSIKTIPNAQGPALISSNEADIGIFYSIHRTKLAKVMEQALYLEPVCLVASPSHPLFQREAVRFTDLDGELFAFPHDTCPCAITLLEHMGDNNAYPSKAYYLGFMSLVAEKAITEHAILAMPYSSVAHYQHHYGLHMLPLKEEPMLMWARMIYRDGELEELPKSILHYGAKHAQSCIRRLPHIYRPVTG